MKEFKRDFRQQSGSKQEMHKALCSRCGKDCMVPFQPTGNRPIFCSNCFKSSAGSTARASGSESFKKPGAGLDRQMYDAVCSTCGNRCRIPFQPRAGKPVFCSHCFEKNGGQEIKRHGDSTTVTHNYSAQFQALNTKLDSILTLLATSERSATTTIHEPLSEESVPKPKRKAVKKRAASKKKASSSKKK